MKRAAAVLWLLARAAAAQPEEDPLVCPRQSDEDPGTRLDRAAEHYRRGQELYTAGEYERAIPEFRAAYCLKPAPEDVFNVAQAYERLVDYEKAVVWFEAYIRLLPTTAAEEIKNVGNRVKALRRLPARIRVATDPPGANVTLEKDGQEVSSPANAESIKVLAGTYRMRVELPGYEPIAETLAAEIGQPYTYSYRLTPKTGTMQVLVSPGEARILVDDKVAGAGSYVDRVSVGPHAVTVEAEGRPTEKRIVVIEPDATTTLRVRMREARAPNGKSELLVASTAFGLLEGGILATGLTEDKLVVTLATTAGGAVGFLAPFLFLPSDVPVGQTSLMIGGRVWGGLEGFSVAAMIYGGEVEAHRREISLVTVGSSVTVGVGMAFLARKLDLSPGDAALVNSGAIWGSATGALSYVAFGQEQRLLGPLLFAGLNVGLLAGGGLAAQLELKRGHVAMIDLSGLAGLVTGVALANAVKLASDDQQVARFGLGGMVLGLVAGAILTSGSDEEPGVTATTGVAVDGAGRFVPTFGVTGRF
ncbi:MAG TPA: PEGA domain-containing protein [Haliangiales bacterium]|nr:PEGA domain-containing protein [Haliangiales bacterium]